MRRALTCFVGGVALCLSHTAKAELDNAPPLEAVPSERPPNPALAGALPTPAAVGRLSTLPTSPAQVSFAVGLLHRPSEGSAAQYQPGFFWSGSVAVSLLEWLRARFSGGMEFHDAQLSQGALTLGEPAQTVPLRALRVGSQIEPVYAITPELDVWLGLGVGWARFTSESLKFQAVPGGSVFLPSRAGVFVEFPVSIGASLKPFGRHFSLSLAAAYTLATGQSGSLFGGSTGERQAVSQDDGKIVTVGGFPAFGHALSTQLSLDYSL